MVADWNRPVDGGTQGAPPNLMPHPAPSRITYPARLSGIATLPFVLVPLLVLLVVWMPVVARFMAPQVHVAEPMVEAARRAPADGVLTELRDFDLMPMLGRQEASEISIAEGILQGRLELPDLPVGQVSIPFSSDDLDRLPPALQLQYAGFVVPDFLLAAYVASGREEFFAAALEFITSWDQFERQSVLPKGLLWNDHATAARVRVLAEFWRIYRSRADFRPEVGQAVLEQAARYGHFLSSPGFFMFFSNHGVMQNLGLLQLSLAFPSLPESERYHQVAVERLGQQMAFFIDENGVIRENSAGYQAYGLEMLGMTFRSMTLLGDPVPEWWAQRYTAGFRFLDSLRRPDGTLPATGDTDGASTGDFPRVTEVDAQGTSSELGPYEGQRPDRALTLHASAGYWINWEDLDGWPAGKDVSQTLVTWTSPPARAHKHADEMSVLLWADNTSWLTSVGYWPYGEPGRDEAESWEGANAPHLVNEDTLSQRTTQLLSQGSNGRAAAVDLERTGPGDYRARRQVVHASPDVWIVLDLVGGAPDATTTSVWTVSPDVDLTAADVPGSYELRSRTKQASARIDYVGSAETVFREYRGSLSPFAGWHVVGETPRPAPAIVVEQPGGEAWLAAVVSRTNGSSTADPVIGRPRASHVASADEWAFTLPTASGQLEIERAGGTIVVTRMDRDGQSRDTLDLSPGPDTATELAEIRAAFDSTSREYPVFQLQWERRMKVSFLLVLLAIAQVVVLLIVGRKWPRVRLPLGVASLLCWAGVAVLLHFFFLQSWLVATSGVG